MRNLTLKICQIVGHKNSGKTTFMGGILEYLTAEGLSCAALKHHSHIEEDSFIIGDSGKHFNKGGVPSALVSPVFSHFSYNIDPPLEAYLAFFQEIPNLNWLLIEGYKTAAFPKMVLVKDKADWDFLSGLQNILGVVTDDPEVKMLAERQFPVFRRDDVRQAGWFLLEKESRCNYVKLSNR